MIAAIGLAIGLLLTSDKAEGFRDGVADNADKLKKKLGKITEDASDEIADLKKIVTKEIEGLGNDVRKKIAAILDEGSDNAKEINKKISKHLA
jgi:gas vesicle protein